jgi:hypothetical protein
MSKSYQLRRLLRRKKKWGMCGRKKRFYTQEEAVIGLIDMKLHTGCNEFMSAYKCPFGSHYHYGHTPERN